MPGPRGKFAVVRYRSPAGTVSWRVSGTKISGERVRKSFSGPMGQATAKAEKNFLDREARHPDSGERLLPTTLTPRQLRLAEIVFSRIRDEDVLRAVDYWNEHQAENQQAKSISVQSAYDSFLSWLGNSNLRPRTKQNLKFRLARFIETVPVALLTEVTPEHVEQFLSRKVPRQNADGTTRLAALSTTTQENDRLVISRFFSWCCERPRCWLKFNPAKPVKVDQDQKPPPSILAVEQCEQLLRAAETFKGGRMVPYIAICLFAGVRPEGEAKRLTWAKINLADKEIRLEASETKTSKPRVFDIVPMLRQGAETHAGPDTLLQWLKAYRDQPIYTERNWRRDFLALKRVIGYGKPTKKHADLKPWPIDVMRHTAVSHYLRLTGSYGQTAEQFGNSEAVIKSRYQGRVTSDETKRFYAILPTTSNPVAAPAESNIIELREFINASR